MGSTGNGEAAVISRELELSYDELEEKINHLAEGEAETPPRDSYTSDRFIMDIRYSQYHESDRGRLELIIYRDEDGPVDNAEAFSHNFFPSQKVEKLLETEEDHEAPQAEVCTTY